MAGGATNYRKLSCLGIVLACMASPQAGCQMVSTWGPETAWTWSSWPSSRLKLPHNPLVPDNLNKSVNFQSDIGPSSIQEYTAHKLTEEIGDDVLAWSLMKCSVCRIMAATAWEKLRRHVHKTGFLPSSTKISEELEEVCHNQAPAFSKAFSAKAKIPGLAKFGPYTEQMCERMIQVPSEFSENPLVANMKARFTSYNQQLNLKVGQRQETLKARPPEPGVCADFHPKCSVWAAAGECQKNPVYMISMSPQGHCHLSCGACLLPDATGDLPPLAAGNELSLTLARNTQISGCKEMQICDNIDESLIPQAIPLTVNQESAGPANRIAGNRGLSPDGLAKKPLSDKAFQELMELGKAFSPPTCILRVMGWWTYQLCHKETVKQIHYGSDGKPAHVIELGSYDPFAQPEQEKTQITEIALGEEMSDLLGYYRVLYTDGDLCKLDDKDQEVRRRTEVQLACSPTKTLMMDVAEVSQCTYQINIYDPAMCLKGHHLSPVLPENQVHEEL